MTSEDARSPESVCLMISRTDSNIPLFDIHFPTPCIYRTVSDNESYFPVIVICE